MAARFAVVIRGTTFTPTGPTPDRVVSFHRTVEAARKAQNKLDQPSVIIDGRDNSVVRI